jgi:nucleotide-binding universal stress UspA family protein
MAVFQTIVHPTDFDEPSTEAFRVARSLARNLGARVVALHVVSPPAVVTQDGRVIRDPHAPELIDLWSEYRELAGDGPAAPVEYAVVVGDRSGSRHLLEQRIRQLGDGALVVMGSHGRRGLRRLLWGSTAEEVVRDCPCPVMVVKVPARHPAECVARPGPAADGHPVASAPIPEPGPDPRHSGGEAA